MGKFQILYPDRDGTKIITRPKSHPHIYAWGTNTADEPVATLTQPGAASPPAALGHTPCPRFWMVVFKNTTPGDGFTVTVEDDQVTGVQIVEGPGRESTDKDGYGDDDPTILNPTSGEMEGTMFGTGGCWTGNVQSVYCELQIGTGATAGTPVGNSKDGTLTQVVGPPIEWTTGMWGFRVDYTIAGTYQIYVATYDGASPPDLIGSATSATFSIT